MSTIIKKDLQEVIKKRNNRLLNFFKSINYPVKLIGSSNNPAVILDDSYVLSMHTHNFNLIFCDKPFDSKEIFCMKLLHEIDIDRNQITELILSSSHRRMYRICEQNSGLFLTGFKFLDKNDESSIYPIFSSKNPKLYFNKENAQSVIDSNAINGSMCIIDTPAKSILEILSEDKNNIVIDQINYNKK